MLSIYLIFVSLALNTISFKCWLHWTPLTIFVGSGQVLGIELRDDYLVEAKFLSLDERMKIITQHWFAYFMPMSFNPHNNPIKYLLSPPTDMQGGFLFSVSQLDSVESGLQTRPVWCQGLHSPPLCRLSFMINCTDTKNNLNYMENNHFPFFKISTLTMARNHCDHSCASHS